MVQKALILVYSIILINSCHGSLSSKVSILQLNVEESELVPVVPVASESGPSTVSPAAAKAFLTAGIINDKLIPKITINPKLAEIDEKYSSCNGIEIREITIPHLQNLFSSGQMSSVDLVKCYLNRLDRMNNVLKVVIDINPDALKEATKMDEERQSGKTRGPLHGIPILLKESIGTQGFRMETTAGSPALIGMYPKNDAKVVTALRKAGAVILGKSNMSEFYWVRGTNVPNGWSGRGGQTRNAYNLNETPEGSSSGSAVAVSANLCAAAVGTETDGSTIVPSSLNGICGMKPTYGLISTEGVIPMSRNQDHIGLMGRTIMDVAALLDGAVLPNERPSKHPPSYLEYLSSYKSPRSWRIGVLRYPYWTTSVMNSTNLVDQLPILEKLLEKVKDSSEFELVDPVEAVSIELFSKVSAFKEYLMILHDVKHDLNEYLKNDVFSMPPQPDSVFSTEHPVITSLKDIIDYNEQHPIVEGYNQEGLKIADTTDGLLNETYIDARDTNRGFAKQFLESIFEKYKLDAIVTPSDSRTQGMLEKSLEDFPPFGFSMACFAGYPSVQIPVGSGSKDGIPFGVTFIGKPYTEPELLKIADGVESLCPQRTVPRFLI